MFKLIIKAIIRSRQLSAEAHIRSQLSRMTDRELADIGICRGDINSVANGTWVNPFDR